MAVVGRRPRSDEYHPGASTHAAAAAAVGPSGSVANSAGEIRMNDHHARPQHHYSDYVQVRELSSLQSCR